MVATYVVTGYPLSSKVRVFGYKRFKYLVARYEYYSFLLDGFVSLACLVIVARKL